MKKNPYFIEPAEFSAAMCRWQDAGKDFSAQDELCIFYYKLAEKQVDRYGRGHIDPLDLVQWCVLSCCQKAKYFDANRGTLFNFFTKVIIHKIRVVYSTENRKFNPQNHVPLDDEYAESVASIRMDSASLADFCEVPTDEGVREKAINQRPVLSVTDILFGELVIEPVNYTPSC